MAQSPSSSNDPYASIGAVVDDPYASIGGADPYAEIGKDRPALGAGDQAAIAALIGEGEQTGDALERVHKAASVPLVGFGATQGRLATVPAIPQLPQVVATPMMPIPLDVAAAGVNTVGGIVSGLTSPENIALLGGAGIASKAAPVLGRIISGGFALDMGHSAYEQIAPLLDTIKNPDLTRQQKLEAGGQFLGTLAMTTAAAVHAISPTLGARVADKTPDAQAKAIREAAAATEDQKVAQALTDAADALEKQLAAKDAADKIAAEQQKTVDEAQKVQDKQLKAAQDIQKAQAQDAANAQEAAKPPEIPKSAQILAESQKPPAIANVATEIGTQTSPFAVQAKINELTAPAPQQIAPPVAEGQIAPPREIATGNKDAAAAAADKIIMAQNNALREIHGSAAFPRIEDNPNRPAGQRALAAEMAPVPIGDRSGRPTGAAEEAIVQQMRKEAGLPPKAPELMTPEEHLAAYEKSGSEARYKRDAAFALKQAEDVGKTPINDAEGFTSEHRANMVKHYKDEAVALEKKIKDQAEFSQKYDIGNAVKEQSPVSAAAVDAYKIKLPSGYVREGDRYIFKPKPEEPTNAIPIKAAGEVGVRNEAALREKVGGNDQPIVAPQESATAPDRLREAPLQESLKPHPAAERLKTIRVAIDNSGLTDSEKKFYNTQAPRYSSADVDMRSLLARINEDAQKAARNASAEKAANEARAAALKLPAQMKAAELRAELSAAGIKTTPKGVPIEDAASNQLMDAVGRLRKGQYFAEPKDIIDVIQSKKRLPKRPRGEVASAGPDLLYDAAHDAALDVAILGIRAGRSIVEVIRMAIAKFKAMHPKATDEQVARLTKDITDAHGTERTTPLTEAEQMMAAAPSVEPVAGRSPEATRAAVARRSSFANAEAWADRVIKERGVGSGALNTIDPELLTAHTIKLVADLGRGTVEFTKWSADKIKEAGEAIKPYLQQIWDAAHKEFETQKSFPQPVAPGGPEFRGRSGSSLLDYDTVAKGTDEGKMQYAKEFATHYETDPQRGITDMEKISDPSFRSVVAAELLSKEFARSAAASVADKGFIEDRINKLIGDIDIGKGQAGQNLQAEAVVNEILAAHRPELALRGALKKTFEETVGKIKPEVTDKVNNAFKDAGNRAADELPKSGLLRGPVERINRAKRIDWREIFTDLPEKQAARQKEIFDRMMNQPGFAALPEAMRATLTELMTKAWEKHRDDIFRQEFGKVVGLPDIPKVKAEKIESAIPKITQLANLGLLDHESFLNALGEQYGIKGMDAETGRKLRELGQKALRTPEGVERNAVHEEIKDVLYKAKGIDRWAALNDYWFRNVMSDPSTGLGIGVGGVINGISRTFTTAYDVAKNMRDPALAVKLAGQFLVDAASGIRLAADLVLTGDRTVMPRYNQKFLEMLSRLESGKPPGGEIASIYRRHTAEGLKPGALLWGHEMIGRLLEGLDYIGSQGVLQQQMIYASLKRGDKASFDAAIKVWNKEASARALAQARAEMPGARWAKIHARTREILNQEISEPVKQWRDQASEMNALNNVPIGYTSHIYKAFNSIPGFREVFSKPLGAVFLKAGLNLFQESTNWTPGTGQINALRTVWGSEKFGLKSLTPEQRNHIVVAQGTGLLLMGAAYSFFNRDDKERDYKKGQWDITGPQRGWTQAEKAVRHDQPPYSIVMPSGRTLSYKNFPQLVGPLGIIGHMRDQQRFNGKKWDAEGALNQIMNAWLGGQGSVFDLSLAQQMSGLASIFATNPQDPDISKTEKVLAQAIGNPLTGIIPFSSALRALDNYLDPQRYAPGITNPGVDTWLRNFPFVRRYVGQGADASPHPMLNFFGDPIQVPATPLRRYGQAPQNADDPLYVAMSDKTADGLTPPLPGLKRNVADSSDKTKPPIQRPMTDDEQYFYERSVRQAFKRQMAADLPAFKAATVEQANNYVNAVFGNAEKYVLDRMNDGKPYNGFVPVEPKLTSALTPEYQQTKELNASEAAPSALAAGRLRIEYDRLRALPADQKQAEYQRVAREDPQFAMKLVDYAKTPATERTALEKSESNLGTESQAKYIADKWKTLRTPAERQAFKVDQYRKGLLPNPVIIELKKMGVNLNE